MATKDIRFQFDDVACSAAGTLSEDEINRYNRDGFVTAFDIFPAEEIERIRRYVNDLIEAKGSDGHYGINCYQSRLSGLWDIATNPRILDHVQDLIGPDILCWASAILSKPPHDPKIVPWHQDAVFWKLNPTRTVTVWLAIDDVDEENSAMCFIPGSHNQGPLDMAQPKSKHSVFHREIADTSVLGKPIVNTLRAGQISLHADMLVHGSSANSSDRRRCGLTLRYCPPAVQITDDTWAAGVEAILCRGRSGKWRTHPRPVNNDIRSTSSPHVVGNN